MDGYRYPTPGYSRQSIIEATPEKYRGGYSTQIFQAAGDDVVTTSVFQAAGDDVVTTSVFQAAGDDVEENTVLVAAPGLPATPGVLEPAAVVVVYDDEAVRVGERLGGLHLE
ncbi:hypothetical protein RRG08_013782 [Elysia crispata]|uniref:Uncharacterized protein n=1 Tax=Elysia crispata TaxID=231223 RepID=A0AAE1A3J2_9GAST|nr:hypothetical protein RRG08_013782 [Elysia crispata]